MNWVMRSARRPPWASPRHDVLRNGILDSKRDKASDVNPALLHKKMLQLLSSLWVTRAVGTFARLGLADVMEDGLADHAAIAAARALDPGHRDRADIRALHAHAVRAAAQLAFAQQHPDHGNLPQRLFRRHVDASRRRSRRRAHRL